ncbi:hypothetical protein BEWA_053770 [Theileria equi strain WA]|uniref:Signal peptide containing protein n=1 Tax=Theileria equi strain WA TaxID=1537102 RepID=L1LD24_THEEQ|nr:hypothetical protein BEWA_053770 [Theileria equi strain WA]EKX73322.1 hypothetical protein BEWA_053770 [Theileria equi strain WA]|eukprot:XP_004832774.1 hypothetical protein BEWA_053770 [Theileria equi strain WA]
MRILAAFYTLLIFKGAFCGKNLRLLDSYNGSTQPNSHVLDLAKPDENFVEVSCTDDPTGVSQKGYNVKDDHVVSSVVEDGQEIWKAAEGSEESCTLALVGSKEQDALLTLHVRNGTSFTFFYFEKVGGAWKDVHEDEFQAKYDEMSNKVNQHAENAQAEDGPKNGRHLRESQAFQSENDVETAHNGEQDGQNGKYEPRDDVVDLAHPTISSVTVDSKGVKQTKYSLGEHLGISSVVYGSQHLWHVGPDDKRCTALESFERDGTFLLVVGVYDNGITVTVPFEKVGEKFKKLSEQVFNSKFHSLMEEKPIPSSHSGPHTIDISASALFPCHSFKFHFDDIPVTVLMPWVENLHITKLVDGEDTVAEATLGGNFAWIAIHTNEERKPDMVMVPGGSAKYTLYKKNGDEWTECQGLGAMNKYRAPVEKKREFILDVSATTEDENFQVFGGELQAFLLRAYFPRAGSYATEVVHGTSKIWKATGDERCLYSEISSAESSCLLILSTDGDKKFSFRHFENTALGWMSTLENDFVLDRE